MQEEVSRLQERCAQLLSDLEEQRAAASGGAAGARAGAAAAAAAAGAAGAAQATSALADRELMLHQIESVKVVGVKLAIRLIGLHKCAQPGGLDESACAHLPWTTAGTSLTRDPCAPRMGRPTGPPGGRTHAPGGVPP